MSWCDGIQPRPKSVRSLRKRTSFRVGGPAPVYFEPKDTKEAARIMERCGWAGVRKYFLGGGTNLIVRDEGVPGAVISSRRLCSLQFRGTRVIAGAGVSLQRLVRACMNQSLSGLEGLVGIPGTLGGAIAQNAGGKWGSIGDVLESVRTVSREGEIRVRTGGDLCMGYRTARLNREFLVEAVLSLEKDKGEEILARMGAFLLQKRKTQPLQLRSAGCIFKNPRGTSAGLLIEKAGLKGSKVGGMAVSSKHANFIVNVGRGSSGDVLTLLHRIEREVEDRFGVQLQREVVLWPDDCLVS